jgi:very-short-patch-repair endonuclease
LFSYLFFNRGFGSSTPNNFFMSSYHILIEETINYPVVKEPIINYAKDLRKNQTPAEVKLWNLLRNRNLNGLKFRRQHPVKPLFILDFYCMELKIAIEIDGGYHKKYLQTQEDQERTILLNLMGIKVIRFTNEEVLENSSWVIQQIIESCRK